MRDKIEVLTEIFDRHGPSAGYITNTGYISREIYEMFPNNKNIFYMQGSMGLSPAIGLGISLGTSKDVVVFVGDASLLMHLGMTHTIRDMGPPNLYVYVLDNGAHESVGGYSCASLEKNYPGISEVFKVSPGEKKPRVGIGFEENVRLVKDFLNE
jgi:phosphonopyruvate decarboxylase